MKDTIRLLLQWECNLKCSYCCNEIPEIRKGIEEINVLAAMHKTVDYKNVCITGGEPFLDPFLVETVIRFGTTKDQNVYIYTNGTRVSAEEIERLLTKYPQLKGINVGLHDEYLGTWDKLINKFAHIPQVRFHFDEIYTEKVLNTYFGDVGDVKRFQFWKKNDCEMNNEDQFVLKMN